MSEKNVFPEGWDAARAQSVLDHYEGQTDREAAREDNRRARPPTRPWIQIARRVFAAIRALIAKQKPVR